MSTNTVPLEILPMGTRWPWYPRYTGTATQDDNGQLHVIGTIAHGHIGLRRWLCIKARQAKAKLGGR